MDHLCHTISRLATVDAPILETWIRHVVLGGVSAITSSPTPQVVPALLTCTTSVENAQNAANDTLAEAMTEQVPQQTTMNVIVPAVASGVEEHQALVQENGLLLQSLTSYMVKERGASCEDAAVALLKAIIPFGAQVRRSTLKVFLLTKQIFHRFNSNFYFKIKIMLKHSVEAFSHDNEILVRCSTLHWKELGSAS